jgi:hypothetical protein
MEVLHVAHSARPFRLEQSLSCARGETRARICARSRSTEPVRVVRDRSVPASPHHRAERLAQRRVSRSIQPVASEIKPRALRLRRRLVLALDSRDAASDPLVPNSQRREHLLVLRVPRVDPRPRVGADRAAVFVDHGL